MEDEYFRNKKETELLNKKNTRQGGIILSILVFLAVLGLLYVKFIYYGIPFL